MEEKRTTCPRCRGRGQELVTQCPLKEIDDDAWDAIGAADMSEHHVLPVAGGYLDQTVCWRDAVSFVAGEKAKLGPSG